MITLNFRARSTTPLVLQNEAGECALACIAMVLGYYGHHTDMVTLRGRHPGTVQGLTLKHILAIAEQEQLCARPLRVEAEELHQLRLPAILHWEMTHFVVLAEVRGAMLVVHDPVRGKRTVASREIDQAFTGVAIELQPAAGFVQQDTSRKLRLADMVSGVHGLGVCLAQILVLSLLLQIFALALSLYTQLFVDDVLVHQDAPLLKILATGFLMVTVTRSVTEWLRSHAVLYVASTISFQLAGKVCRQLFRLPLQWYTNRHLGDIVSRFGSLNQIRDFLSSGIVEVSIDALMVLGTLGLMLVYSVKLTLVALVAVVVYGAVRVLMHPRFHRANEACIHAAARENTVFMENVRAIQGIRQYGKEADRLAGWQNRYAEMLNAGVRLQQLGIRVKLVHGLLLGTENIVLMLLGGFAVLNNEISIGMVMAYISFKDQFYTRVFALLDKVFEFRMLALHLNRLADIALAEPEQQRTGIGAPPLAVCLQGGLKLTGVGFRHSPGLPWLFRDICLEVGNEEVVAIIGPTGCGKSTLLKLVMSLLQPESGTVSMHGVDIRIMGLDSYRQRIAGVMQDDIVLSGTLFDNITFFDPEPDREQVEYVSSLAALADEIRVMPMQYNTLVGSMGAALSGGQVQRLLLARALYKRPRLLVLDEATSHLDLATEKIVNTAIRQMKIARLMVAHRPDSILLADRILALTPTGLEPVSRQQLLERQAAGNSMSIALSV